MKILDDELSIRLVPHKENKTLFVIDNGIGMTSDGMFVTMFHFHSLCMLINCNVVYVGFYSAFLVAQKVIITSQYNDLGQYIW